MEEKNNNDGLDGIPGDVGALLELMTTGVTGVGQVKRVGLLTLIDLGIYHPDPSTRLGAYAATKGYPRDTVGNAVHHAIGAIYVPFGAWGQERIGTVFNSPRAKELFSQPVQSEASLRIATIEYEYWSKVLDKDPLSAGAWFATKFNPKTRDFLQRNIFRFP